MPYRKNINNIISYNKGLWILSKWSRKTSIAKADFYLPDLRRSIEDPLTDNNIEKTEILAASFFPKTGVTDLNNINYMFL